MSLDQPGKVKRRVRFAAATIMDEALKGDD